MYTFSLKAALLGMALTCGLVKAAPIDIVSNTSGTMANGNAAYVGQAFTTAATGGPWDDIALSFYSNEGPATAFYSQGDLFLFSTPYTGTPAGLSTSVTGFIAEALASNISGGMWVFNPSVTLQAGTEYYVYSDVLFAAEAITGGDIISGGQVYAAGISTTDFTSATASLNFQVNGSAVPEPGSIGLTLIGLGWLGRRFLASSSKA